MLEKHLENLGTHAADLVTGHKGIIISIAFDVSGCIQYLVKPRCDKDGKHVDSLWVDAGRCAIDRKRGHVVPPAPWKEIVIATGRKGPAEKPLKQ